MPAAAGLCRASLLACGLVLAAGAPVAEVAPRRLELADLGAVIEPSGHAISPDGRHIAVVIQEADFTANRYVKSLALVDVASGAVERIANDRRGLDAVQWSPSGDRLAWLEAAAGGKPQIHVAAPGPVPASLQAVTRVPGGVEAFKWSPDGRSFAFTAENAPPEPSADDPHNRSFDAGEGDYLATSAPRSSHLWRVSAAGGEPLRLTAGRESVEDLEWLADGQRIAFTSQPTPAAADYIDQSLKTVGIDGGEARTLVSESRAILQDNPLRLSPDGRWIAFCRNRGAGRESEYFPENISLVSAEGGERREATPAIDRDIVAMAWLPDSRGFVAAAPERTRFALWHQPLTGVPRQLELGPVATVWEITIAGNGTLAFIGSEPDRPPELYVKASLDAKPRRLTGFNDRVAALEQGRVETIRWQSDGFEHDGVLFFPPGFRPGDEAPLVLNIHGGPSQPSSEGWHWSDDGLNRVMAARGWIVFTPNYRGTGSMGLEYQSAVVNDSSAGPARDVMAGVAAVKEHTPIDEERVAVSGYSYGGLMTVWLAAHYPGWRAAVAGAAVTDHFDWYNLADYNVTWGLGMNGSPWLGDNAENYWRQSPIAYAGRIRAPMLILSGTHDRRVTITQSYKLYHALKDNGVPVSFIAYPDSGHWPESPVHERDMFRRWIDWIDAHFRDGASPPPSP